MRSVKLYKDPAPVLPEGPADLTSFKPEQVVRSCPRLESGLRLGPEGVRACQFGAFASPLYWENEALVGRSVSKQAIVEKRRWLFRQLNDDVSDIACKRCQMAREKPFAQVRFDRLGQIDHAPSSVCNLRCTFCGFTKLDTFHDSLYDDLAILREFTAEDTEWDSVVDFNGGEPSLRPDLATYLETFTSRRIRVRLMTNGVRYRQEIYDGLAAGTIQWVCTSIDAGTPSTYQRLKKSDSYARVLENAARYAQAGSRGGGMFAAKYIFCGDNCSDDDLTGFAYAMLAIRPQQVWLTYDFTAFGFGDATSEDLSSYDLERDIRAYAKLWLLLEKHGLTPVHYSIGHLALISRQGQTLFARTQEAIEALRKPADTKLALGDFRQGGPRSLPEPARFDTGPLRIRHNGGRDPAQPWDLRGKRVLLAPACALSLGLLADEEIKAANLLGFVDRDVLLRGKRIEGLPVYGYEALGELQPDVVLVAAPEQHRAAIVYTVTRHLPTEAPSENEALGTERIVLLDRTWGPAVGCQGHTGYAPIGALDKTQEAPTAERSAP